MTGRVGVDPERYIVTKGARYVAAHPRKDWVEKSIHRAIGRLIDDKQFTWNDATDQLTMTVRGEEEAARIDWWWDNNWIPN
jgi:hypothetical protein